MDSPAVQALSIREIKSIIDEVWKRERIPQEEVFGKWMGKDDEFNPFHGGISGWVTPDKMLYRSLYMAYYKEGSSLIVNSPIEMWHVCYHPLDRTAQTKHKATHVYGIKTSVAKSQQQYFIVNKPEFVMHGTGLYRIINEGLGDEVTKERTAIGRISITTTNVLLTLKKEAYDQKSKPLHEKIITSI